jgi:hypothetical protein
VRPSVIISPTDFIAVTDGISLLVKLVNGVVIEYMIIIFLIGIFKHSSN